MNSETNTAIVGLPRFICAIRDSGYKGTHSAIAELVDNALEANATEVDIQIYQPQPEHDDICIAVIDNGSGMSPKILELALQFGGSTHFNSRIGIILRNHSYWKMIV